MSDPKPVPISFILRAADHLSEVGVHPQVGKKPRIFFASDKEGAEIVRHEVVDIDDDGTPPVGDEAVVELKSTAQPAPPQPN